MASPEALVDVDWLNQRLDAEDIVVVDGTVHLPDTGRDAFAEYEAEHIPGALFFDLAKVADPDNPLPRKIPPRDVFVREVSKLGISDETHVVAYDSPGLYSAARIWWLFRHFGCNNVSVLDGGLKAWKDAGRPTEKGARQRPSASFAGGETKNLLALAPDVLAASRSGKQILDARTPGRFSGSEMDRYPGTRPGHVPNSQNLYWAELLDGTSRKMLPKDALRKRFEQAGVDFDRPVIISCGSGLTACILALGLHQLGKDDWRVYDGSWDEWGRNHELPTEMGSDVKSP